MEKKEAPRCLYLTFGGTHYFFCATGIPLDSWKEPSLIFYGRAELKQSDHRPVVGIVDVQARIMILMK